MNLSKGKSATPKPPEKGSFPLDHDGECGVLMRAYMQCLKENDYVSRYCRAYSKGYLQCRMNHGLMAQEELTTLGFDGSEEKLTKPITYLPK